MGGGSPDRFLTFLIKSDFVLLHDLKRQGPIFSPHPERPAAGLALVFHHAANTQRPVQFIEEGLVPG